MSPIPLGFLALSGAGGIQYWIGLLGGASSDEGHSVSSFNESESYSVGTTTSAGIFGNSFLISKYSSFGDLLFQKTLGGADQDFGRGVKNDSSGNVFVVGYTLSAGAGGVDCLLAKYNSTGTLQFQRVLGDSQFNSFLKVDTDSSGNIYPVGEHAGTFLLSKYDSSAVNQFNRTLGSTDARALSVRVSSTSDIYLCGFEGAGTNSNATLAKYNSSGTLQWQRQLNETDYGDIFTDLILDSSSNVYAVGQSNRFSEFKGLIAKYNSSGTIQWQRQITSSQTRLEGVAVDSLDNLYVVGRTNSSGAGANEFFIIKYNSSGTIQWQRTLGSSAADNGFAVEIDSKDNLIFTGNSTGAGSGGDDQFIAKLPSDGSLTGTYVLDGVNFIYQASSLSESASALTASTSSLSSASLGLTSSASSLTSADTSLTYYLTPIT